MERRKWDRGSDHLNLRVMAHNYSHKGYYVQTTYNVEIPEFTEWWKVYIILVRVILFCLWQWGSIEQI